MVCFSHEELLKIPGGHYNEMWWEQLQNESAAVVTTTADDDTVITCVCCKDGIDTSLACECSCHDSISDCESTASDVTVEETSSSSLDDTPDDNKSVLSLSAVYEVLSRITPKKDVHGRKRSCTR